MAALVVCAAPRPLFAGNAEEAALHAQDAPFELPPSELQARASRVFAPAPRQMLRRSVFGFYPYWGGDWTSTRFDLLTSLAVFGVDLDSNGNISNRHGWGTPTQNALVTEAKNRGVKVSLTVVNFTASSLSVLLGDPAHRQNAIDRIMGEVHAGGAEGVAIDFETLPAAQRANFVSFTTDLGTRLRSEIPDAELSVAMPAVNWSNAYDYVGLATAADLLFIMGYDYYYSGGPPGPVSPLQSGAIWGTHNLQATVRDYLQVGGRAIRAKLILGLPWYGRNWPTNGPGIPAGRGMGASSSVLYHDVGALLAAHPRQWDPMSINPYMAWQDATGWRQVFYDDAESFGAKLDFADGQDLAGVGFWALTYERGTSELWEALEQRFSIPAGMPDAGGRPDSGLRLDAGVRRDSGLRFDMGVRDDQGVGEDAASIDAAGTEADAGPSADGGAIAALDAAENRVPVDASVERTPDLPSMDPGEGFDATDAMKKQGCGCRTARLALKDAQKGRTPRAASSMGGAREAAVWAAGLCLVAILRRRARSAS